MSKIGYRPGKWKDEEYRMSLTDAQRAMLPDNPAGLIELSDADLSQVDGGATEACSCCCSCGCSCGCCRVALRF